jgi:4-amino-4-deoxy-L-arabinose transferase-like glycosyltransferase
VHVIGIPERYRPLARILIVAGAVRSAFLLVALLAGILKPWPYLQDSRGYFDLAMRLVQHGRYITINGEPEVYRTPAYPALLALASYSGHATRLTIVLQIALGVATVALVYFLARALSGDDRLSRVAAWLAAIEPLLGQYSTHLMTETVFTFLLTAALVTFARTSPASIGGAVLTGILASATAFVRPVGYLLPAIFVAAAFVSGWRQPFGLRLRRAGIIAAIAILSFGSWQARNAHVANYAGFSTQPDRQLYLTTYAWARASAEHRSFDSIRQELIESIWSSVGPADPFGPVFTAEARRRSAAALRPYFWTALRHQLTGSAIVLLKPPGGELRHFFEAQPPSQRLLWFALTHSPAETLRLLPSSRLWLVWQGAYALYWMLFLAVCAIGVVRLRHYPALLRGLLLPMAVAIYLLLATGGYFAEARFRHPLMPLLCVIAAAGVVRLSDRIAERRRKTA